MSFKSIIDIDINDEKFKSFLESFQRYSEEAEKAPEDWHKLADAISGAERRVKGFGGAQNKALKDGANHASAAGKSLRGYTGAAGAASTSTRRLDSSLRKTHHSQKSFADNVRHSGNGLESFALDAGASALGLDELAGPLGLVAAGVTAVAVGAAKAALSLDKLTAAKAKNAKEMGMTIAQQQAFQNYGSQMFENPDAMMAQIYKAKINPADRRGLLAAGLTNQQISSESTAQLAFQFAKKMRARLMTMPADVRGAEWKAITGDQFGGAAQVGLLTNTKLKTMQGYEEQYKKHEHAYAIAMAEAHNAARVSQAASELKSSVVTKLENAANSKAATAASMTTIRSGRALVDSVNTAGGAFAARVERAGAAFAGDLHNILHGKSVSTEPLGATAAHVLLPHDKLAKQGYVKTLNNIHAGWGTWWQKHVAQTLTNPGAWGVALKNPGNIEKPNAKMFHGEKKFMKYNSWGQGYRAQASDIRSYPKRFGADTIASIARIYDPTSKYNSPAQQQAYINNISRWSHLKPNQPLDLNNPSVLSRYQSAIDRMENGIKVSPQNVEKAWGPHYLALLEQIAHNTAQHHIHVHTNTGKVSVAAHAAAR